MFRSRSTARLPNTPARMSPIPMGAILSAALMLESLGLSAEAAAIEAAVKDSVMTSHGTAEIGGTLGTRETGDYIAGCDPEEGRGRYQE